MGGCGRGAQRVVLGPRRVDCRDVLVYLCHVHHHVRSLRLPVPAQLALYHRQRPGRHRQLVCLFPPWRPREDPFLGRPPGLGHCCLLDLPGRLSSHVRGCHLLLRFHRAPGASFGVLFTIASVCYSAIRVSVSSSDLESLVSHDRDLEQILLLDDYDKQEEGDAEDNAEVVTNDNAAGEPDLVGGVEVKNTSSGGPTSTTSAYSGSKATLAAQGIEAAKD